MGNDSGAYVVRGRVVEWDATRVRRVDDILTAWAAINADRTVVAGSGLLIDNGVSEFDAPIGDVTTLADALAYRLPKIIAVAIVVATDLHFGMARQFQVFASKGPAVVEIFRDLDKAREWLRQRTDSVPPGPSGAS